MPYSVCRLQKDGAVPEKVLGSVLAMRSCISPRRRYKRHCWGLGNEDMMVLCLENSAVIGRMLFLAACFYIRRSVIIL